MSTSPLTFSGLAISFGTSALINLGQMEDPSTEQTSVDLASAKQSIDMLHILAAKTKGNLTPEEDSLLRKLLLDLQLAYVKASQVGAGEAPGSQH